MADTSDRVVVKEIWWLLAFMRIFITGIAGFIGSWLAKDFKSKGYYVHGIDNLTTGRKENLSPDVQWEEQDIRDNDVLSAMQEPFDIVIHLAAQTSGEKSFEMPIYDMETNLKGSYHIYQFARKCETKLLINFSSMSIYGDVDENIQVCEDYPPKPISLYGNTKLSAENLLSMLAKKDNFPVTTLRLFNAYGPGQNLNEMKQGMVSIFLAYLLTQDEIIVKGSLKRIRDFIYIDDIVKAVNRIIESDPCIGCYNLCSGETVSIEKLLDVLMQAFGKRKPVRVEGNTLGDIIGFAGSYERLQEKFSWQPSVSIEDGVEETIKFYTNVI